MNLPLRSAALPWKLGALALLAFASLLPAQQGPTLPPGAEALRVPAGNVVSAHVYALGFQIYQWDATTSRWAFVAPAAVLFDVPSYQLFGVHYVGPTWKSTGGSTVVGALDAGVTVDPTAIPWLLLRAVSSQGPGVFAGTTFIQRVHTTRGRAPTRAGVAGEKVWIPYTAEYYFYRAR